MYDATTRRPRRLLSSDRDVCLFACYALQNSILRKYYLINGRYESMISGHSKSESARIYNTESVYQLAYSSRRPRGPRPLARGDDPNDRLRTMNFAHSIEGGRGGIERQSNAGTVERRLDGDRR